MSKLSLRGSSWDHPRGHAPMVATAEAYRHCTEGQMTVEWLPRSLREFGAQSVEQLAREFDLIVIDHPHVGAMAETGSVIALDEIVDPEVMDELGEASPGGSFASYQYQGHLWALPIDVACQVSAHRADLIGEPPRTWDAVLELARQGRVVWPLCDVDATCSFFSLTAHLGKPCCVDGVFADPDAAQWALEMMAMVVEASAAVCRKMNPIQALELMTRSDEVCFAPLLFGYVNYARTDRAGTRIRFGDIPLATGVEEPSGSLLGGAGLAISSRCTALQEAVSYALYVASAEVQRTIYFRSGGQPAHTVAWEDRAVDQLAGGFFSGTARTVRRAWTRPRYPGFDEFQNGLFAAFSDWPRDPRQFQPFLRRLQTLYEQSIEELC